MKTKTPGKNLNFSGGKTKGVKTKFFSKFCPVKFLKRGGKLQLKKGFKVS
ncbi:MAG: hypothetical protein CM15mV43_790 [uncultured marine virus]|nr:MAG: hypothetical protein CM15mV43_790 [uncultured marine virus]